jgi:hypothetical protein
MPSAGLAAQNTLAKDSTFIGRVESAIVAEAFAIIAEPPGTGNHDQRARAAKSVLGNPAVYATMMAFGVATDPQVAADAGTTPTPANVTDADISNAVSGMWNAYFVDA